MHLPVKPEIWDKYGATGQDISAGLVEDVLLHGALYTLNMPVNLFMFHIFSKLR
jgi:hypothetical protein